MSKKIIIIIIILLIGFILICFSMGYKIPKWDKHGNWINIPENKDLFFEIEKTDIKGDFVLDIPNFKGHILLQADNDFVIPTAITKKGKIIKRLPKTKDFYVDSVNQRLILSEDIYKSDTLFKKRLFAYNLKNFQKGEELMLKNHLIPQTFYEFLEQKNYKLNQIYELDEKKKLKEEYRNGQKKEVYFYKTLYPVTKVSVLYEPFDTDFYTNKNGEIFCVDSQMNSHNQQEIWASLYPIFSNYDKILKITSPQIPSILEADSPTIESNFIASGYLRVEIRQHNLLYQKVKFGKKYFNFKVSETNPYFPNPLNSPIYEKDTLAFMLDKNLYQVYLKTNKIK